MATNNRVVPSIIVSIALLFLFQLLLFRAIMPPEGRESYGTEFLLAAAALHLLLLAFLIWRRRDFVLLPSQRPLRRVNLPNVLSLFRISATPSILLYLLLFRRYDTLVPAMILTGAAFISDLLDGAISRRFGQVTRIGRYLDSVSDYAILLAVCLTIDRFGLISRWFFILILIRFLGQGLGVTVLLLIGGTVTIGATYLGKVAVFSTMVTLGLSLLQPLAVTGDRYVTFFRLLEYPVALLLLLSLVEKILLLLAGARRSIGSDEPSIRR